MSPYLLHEQDDTSTCGRLGVNGADDTARIDRRLWALGIFVLMMNLVLLAWLSFTPESGLDELPGRAPLHDVDGTLGRH